MITKPMLPPKFGYVEVEVNGVRKYRNTKTGVLLEDERPAVSNSEPDFDVWDELDKAYTEGVNSAYDQ